MNMVFTTHFFGTRPPYSTARPGTLIRPTKVAAVSCHDVLPVSSHGGWQALGGDVEVHTVDAACSAVVISANNGPVLSSGQASWPGWPVASRSNGRSGLFPV